ncbi:retrovirus-related pol polyprotein from transposon TNT 1-94 [Tanacetum coccineum]
MAVISMDGVETLRWLWGKLKLGFIDGSCVKPASDHDDLQRWIGCDYMVTCWILNSMVTELLDAFLYAQSACELWKEIRERYGQSNGPLLNDEYESVRSQILAMDPLPTVNKAYCIVQQIEKQKQVTNHVFEPAAFFANMNNKNDSFDEHFIRETPFDMGYENEVSLGQNGHVDQKLVAAVCQEMMKEISDSGASDHMSPHLNLFISTKHLKKLIIVHFLDGTSKTVTIVGQVQLTPSLILTDVFYIPDFQLNLLSVSNLIKTRQLAACFYANDFVFHDLTTNQIVVVGKGYKNLYICKPTLDQATFDAEVSAFCKTYQNVILVHCFNKNAFSNSVSKHYVDIKTFHKRLAYTSVSKLVHIPQYKHLDVSSFSCECCLLSKHHRLPFQRSTSIAKNPFDLIHVDLWGPFKHHVQDGAHYFYAIMDDHTRATWTYLVHSKTQVYDLLVSFLAYVTNHFKTSVKIIRSDNGTEIVNAACNSLFMSKGILHHRSMAYTPQQNGVVERKHRHLLDTARAIRLHANLSIKFWGDCPSPQPQALETTFEARVRDYMAAHTERIERFENALFKQREGINSRMTEMFRLLKELTTSRTLEKVTPDNIERPTETEAEMPVKKDETKNEAENGTRNKSIKIPENEEAVKAPGY